MMASQSSGSVVERLLSERGRCQLGVERLRQKSSGLPMIANDEELASYIYGRFGAMLPGKRVCPGHKPPFEAFADPYFARAPVTVWKASRGVGGKSYMLALLGLVEATTLG